MKKLNLFFATPFFLLALVVSSCSNMNDPLVLQDSTQSPNNTRSKELRSVSISAHIHELDAIRGLNNIALEYVEHAKNLLTDDETYIRENIQ